MIKELDENYWFGGKDDVATCRAIVAYMGLIQDADLAYPVILSYDSCVMDGMHRISKALNEGNYKIIVVQFKVTPVFDNVNISPDELTYE